MTSTVRLNKAIIVTIRMRNCPAAWIYEIRCDIQVPARRDAMADDRLPANLCEQHEQEEGETSRPRQTM